MEKYTSEAFQEQVFENALDIFDISADEIELIGGFNNIVYQYQKNNQEFILRFTHDSHRKQNLVRGEVDWINYLSNNGLSVCRANKSKRDRLVEVIETDDSSFSAVSFNKAPGNPPQTEDWNEELFVKMGEMIGKMHSLTKNYNPLNDKFKRPEWYQDMDLFAKKYVEAVDEEIIDKFKTIREYPENFPQDKDSYGLIHCDFHSGNFHLDSGNIFLFDFDDCQYTWFVEDIAMALFYSLPFSDEIDIEKAKRFYTNFMEGYFKENSITNKWLKEIPYFLKQREINIYIVLKASETDHVFMKNRREKIINDIPYVELNFA